MIDSRSLASCVCTDEILKPRVDEFLVDRGHGLRTSGNAGDALNVAQWLRVVALKFRLCFPIGVRHEHPGRESEFAGSSLYRRPIASQCWRKTSNLRCDVTRAVLADQVVLLRAEVTRLGVLGHQAKGVALAASRDHQWRARLLLGCGGKILLTRSSGNAVPRT